MVAPRKITRNPSYRNVGHERNGDDVSCVKPFGMFWNSLWYLLCFTVYESSDKETVGRIRGMWDVTLSRW
jgi:hypothetical protein